MSGPRTALIQALVEEHQHIKGGLAILEEMRNRLSHRGSASLADLTMLVSFFSEYADRIHHHAEEEQLFTAVEKTTNRRLKQMQGKLGTQHLMGRVFVGEMKNALKEARVKRRGWRSHFIENAKAFRTLLTVHICDENHLYFPLAEKALVKRDGGAGINSIHLPAGKKTWERRIDRLIRKYCPAKNVSCDGSLLSSCHSCSDRK